QFVSVLEPHGSYNPSKEFTLNASSSITALSMDEESGIVLVTLTAAEHTFLIAIDKRSAAADESNSFTFNNTSYSLDGRFAVYEL
ncbi:MAG: alginate lyase, partial [Pseudomonadota bacterium]|nr:alginate lyase [Pseudomonadota bacterium]